MIICFSSFSVNSLNTSISSRYLLSSDKPVRVKCKLSFNFSSGERSFSDFRINKSPVDTLLFLRVAFSRLKG